jgi:hypothetical protein
LLDEYLRFLAGRCRPNTVLAAAYDLKVFFTIVGKAAEDVRPADVLAFVTAQRTGHPSIGAVVQPVGDDDEAGVSLRTVRRRLSSCVAITTAPRPKAAGPGAADATAPSPGRHPPVIPT